MFYLGRWKVINFNFSRAGKRASSAEPITRLQRPLQFALGLLLTAKYFGAYWMDSMMGIVGALLVTRWSWDLPTATGSALLALTDRPLA